MLRRTHFRPALASSAGYSFDYRPELVWVHSVYSDAIPFESTAGLPRLDMKRFDRATSLKLRQVNRGAQQVN